MGQNKWTNEQLDAITGQGCNLLVAAAAGSGKTAVLVERIVRRITDRKNPVDVDKLLVVTFTNAAAAEMRERLAAAIADKLSENPVDKNLQKQLILLNKASITTIHSFCLDVIRNNYTATDLDPAFTIIDDAETKMLREEALEDVFAKKYENENEKTDENFINLLEGFGYGRDDVKLHEKILQVYEFTRSFPWPEEWMQEVLSQYKKAKNVLGFEELIWGKKLIVYAKTIIDAALGTAYYIRDLVRGEDGFEGYEDTADDDIEILKNIADSLNSTWDDAYEAVSFSMLARLNRCGKEADEATKVEFKMGRDMVKSIISKIREDVFVAPSDVILDEINLMAPVIETLIQLVKDFSTEFAAKKAEKNGVDFSDLEHFALKILTEGGGPGDGVEVHLGNVPSQIAINYRNKFVEVLVDEYQDSNLIQETILTTVSRQGTNQPNMFMVGDIKQSIYKFRLAMPEIFMGKYKSYSYKKDSNERKIKLFKNFRSREPIINGVNYIFKQIMSDEVGELDYNDDEALKVGLVYPDCDKRTEYCGGSTEIIIVDTFIPKPEEDNEQLLQPRKESVSVGSKDSKSNNQELNQEQEEIPDNVTAEVRAIGKRINELMSPDKNGKIFVVFDKNENIYKPIKFRDIVILMRSPGSRSEIFTKELANMGIPVYADVGEAFFKSLETMTILALLQVLDNPLCDIPLISVLLSPIGGFNAEELAIIRKDDKKSAFYNAIQARAKLEEEINSSVALEDMSTLSAKCIGFIEKVNRWRKMSTYMPIDNLIWLIYTETSYFAIVGAYPGGRLRQANLKMLFEKAGQYEKSTFKGLFNFMNYMDKVRTGNFDLGSAKILGENEDVVRIMSIHKSKGLEFPVVFLAGCGKKINMTDLTQEIMLHRDLGIGSDFVNVEKRLRYTTPVKEAIKFNLKVETISEEMRILYTGLTRAREKLIVTGTVSNVCKKALKWRKNIIKCESKLLPYFMLESSTYFDFICSSIMRHPDGDCLRSFVDLGSTSYMSDSSKWNINITHISELAIGVTGTGIIDEFADSTTPFNGVVSDSQNQLTLNEKQIRKLIKRLNYVYPYGKKLLPSKITVTELKRKYANVENEYTFKPGALKKPHFIEGKGGFTAAEKGTIVHFVMQHIDIFSAQSIEDVHNYIKKMTDLSLITEEEAATVDAGIIYGFINSPICKRIIAAGNLQREIPFSINLDVGELTGNEKYKNSDVLLQGIIDCYFIENDEIVILDYKTDYIAKGNEESIKERYSLQLKCYKKALEIIIGKRVKNTYIYLFSNGNLLEF